MIFECGDDTNDGVQAKYHVDLCDDGVKSHASRANLSVLRTRPSCRAHVTRHAFKGKVL